MPRQVSKKAGKGSRGGKAPAARQSKPHVISLRVGDREKHLLEQLSRRRAKNLSAVVRELLEEWLTFSPGRG
ncbi:MAG: ribbon-helix-helix protein, CopG family [Deltaproteobacteria bacterium]|nr:MAG: ribbon-helix-helix protein, CopG family [Deltaproteobacteria bacterium]